MTEADADDFPMMALAVLTGAFMVGSTLILGGGGLVAQYLLEHLAGWAAPWPVAVGIGTVGEAAVVAAFLLAWVGTPAEE